MTKDIEIIPVLPKPINDFSPIANIKTPVLWKDTDGKMIPTRSVPNT
jgi:hypothetical protein